ncbi:MAG: thiamine-phosphate kinase, partial [Cytophagales bacterium]|nr:thiamine-phosphate kinase [Cytophagales bacterium]
MGDDAAVIAFPAPNDSLYKKSNKQSKEHGNLSPLSPRVTRGGQSRDKLLLFSTDMLVEGIHFDMAFTPLKHLGYKAVVVNISDIAAMNGIAQQITVSLALSNRYSLEAIEELYEGIRTACKNYNVDLVGGDTTSSVSGLIISVAIVGTVEKENISYRNTGKKNDLICVTGDLGGAYIGLQLLEREKQVFLDNQDMQPELEGKDYVVKRQLMPEARTDIIYELKDLNIVPTSMIDISDGLASELLHICNSSKVGAKIYKEKLPIEKSAYETAVEFKLDPTTCMLNGGEDYELLFTINTSDFGKIKNHPDITTIGHLTEKKSGVNLITKEGNMVEVKAQGWEHF